jgi:hypothetical protein
MQQQAIIGSIYDCNLLHPRQAVFEEGDSVDPDPVRPGVAKGLLIHHIHASASAAGLLASRSPIPATAEAD